MGTCLSEVAMPAFPSHSLSVLRLCTFLPAYCLQLPDFPKAEVQLKHIWQKTETAGHKWKQSKC